MPKVINSVSHHYLQLSQWPLKHKAKNWLEQNDIYQEVIAKLVAANAVIVSQLCDKVIILRSIPHHCFTPLPIIRPRKVKRKKKKKIQPSDHRQKSASGRSQRAIGTRSGQSPLALQIPVRTWWPRQQRLPGPPVWHLLEGKTHLPFLESRELHPVGTVLPPDLNLCFAYLSTSMQLPSGLGISGHDYWA